MQNTAMGHHGYGSKTRNSSHSHSWNSLYEKGRAEVHAAKKIILGDTQLFCHKHLTLSLDTFENLNRN